MNHFSRNRRNFLVQALGTGFVLGLSDVAKAAHPGQKKIRVGVIGLSVHGADYTEIMNSRQDDPAFSGCKVVALYHPSGNPDVEFSPDQLSKFRQTVQKNGVELVSTMKKLLDQSDAVMLLTNDGRPHMEQILPVLKAGKPVFVDKPVAESLSAVVALYEAGRKYRTPIFSCSPLRYVRDIEQVVNGTVAGEIIGADTYGPAPIQKSHAALFWDGIHGIELLYAVMGPGCKSVAASNSVGTDIVTGTWEAGKLGVFRGLRKGKVGFGGKIFGSEKIAEIGKFEGYENLVREIVKFFRTGDSPVAASETVEIYTFMEAAHESMRRGGSSVVLSEILSKVKVGGY